MKNVRRHNKSRVNILLSTFNGEKYLPQLLDSLVSQSYVYWRLLVRDDGSQDNTLAIINAYLEKYPSQITLLVCAGNAVNKGVVKSFFELLAMTTDDYIMLCDQDDVWLPGKIEITLAKMQAMEDEYGGDTPMLVHTDLRVVDASLRLISLTRWNFTDFNKNGAYRLGRMMTENIVTGCTVMVNGKLRDMMIAASYPDCAVMHDWWLALIANVFGKIAYVPVATICYRQHANNTIGANKEGLLDGVKKLLNFKVIRQNIQRSYLQAEGFLTLYGEKISEPKVKDQINCYANMRKYGFLRRGFYMLKYRFFKRRFVRSLFLFLLS